MGRILVALTWAAICLNTYSYSVFTIKKVNWSKVKKVDVFIAGYGEEMGLQFLYGAITKAQLHDEMYGSERAQVIMWAEEWNKRKDREVLRDRGFEILEVNSRHLFNSKIEDEIQKFPAISSLHVFSHNAAWQGSAIQSYGDRMGPGTFAWGKIKAKFTKDSYVILHGCNTGFVVAPAISKIIERPVLGSLTSTDFQEIFQGDQWYHNNSWDYPSNLSKLTSNKLLFNSTQSCWKGFCHRMMPLNKPYVGYWGHYKTGLPFYKSFCNYGPKGAENKTGCLQGIGQAVNAWATLEGTDYQTKVEDFICPRVKDPSVFQTCLKLLRTGSSPKFFRGNTSNCPIEKCEYDVVTQDADGGKVQGFIGTDNGNGPILKEYELLMKAGETL